MRLVAGLCRCGQLPVCGTHGNHFLDNPCWYTTSGIRTFIICTNGISTIIHAGRISSSGGTGNSTEQVCPPICN